MTCAQKCRHCGVTIVVHEPTGEWWHTVSNTRYRACRDDKGTVLGRGVAEPEGWAS